MNGVKYTQTSKLSLIVIEIMSADAAVQSPVVCSWRMSRGSASEDTTLIRTSFSYTLTRSALPLLL